MTDAELQAFVSDAAEKHIAQSLSEMSDPAQFDRWKDGTRAREEAEMIVQSLLAKYRA